MARVPAQNRLSSFFGGRGRLPPSIGFLMATILIASIVGAVGARNGFPLLAYGVLVADRLRSLELWRAVTWVFFEASPYALLFTFMVLYWFGRDLSYRWGATRFILTYFLLTAGIAAGVFGLSQIYRPLGALPYFGSGAIGCALVILWGSYYATRQMQFMFVVTLTGAQLIWVTVGMTVLFSLFHGAETFVPEFLAEALALAWVYAPSPREMWLEHKLRGMEQKRRASHLHSVPRDKDENDSPPDGRWLN